MITELSLKNWKAYKNLNLELHSGTTFVIARNGIGKTSLVQGAMWALFGELSDADPASCLRSGASSATAAVSLTLGADRIRISRHYSAETRQTETAITVGDHMTAGTQAVEKYLSQVLGAEPSILAKMCFLREGEAVAAEASAAEDLRSHLARVFGLDTLLLLSAGEADRRRRLTREARETRRTQRLAESARAELAARLGQLDVDLEALRLEQEATRTVQRQAQSTLATLTSWSDFDSANQRWVAERKELVDRISRDLGIGEILEGELAEHLAAQRVRSQTRLEELSREAGALEAERSILVNFAASLGNTEVETCPVCLRLITPEERQHAERAHADRIQELARLAATISAEIRASRTRLTQLDRWISELDASARSPLTPSSPRPDPSDESALVDAQASVTAAVESLAQIAGRVARLEEERSGVAEELKEDAEAASRSAELFRRYREEALSELISTTLKRSAEEIRARRIDPLATEIQNRWKLLWPNRAPLKLLPDGRLVAMRAGREIPYREFSGGEKVIATVILRLLALSMTTTTPFLWLDEPLEHLDPRNRRMVASLLVKASEGDKTKQIVATTYEEAVARRLDETHAAQLVYVEAEPDG